MVTYLFQAKHNGVTSGVTANIKAVNNSKKRGRLSPENKKKVSVENGTTY